MDPIKNSLPRLFTCINHDEEYGNLKEYTWDQTAITVVDPDLFNDDKFLLQNIVEGHIVSSKIYPLVYDAIGSHKGVSFRSLEFYGQVNQDNTLYDRLLPEEKHFFLIGIRDLFVASCRNMLSNHEQELLRRVSDLIDPEEDDADVVCKEILNMRVTACPTRSHKLARFIPFATVASGNELIDECFMLNDLDMVIGFVDPCELSYHNFENIVNLDSLFRKSDQFKIRKVQELPNSDILTFNLVDESHVLQSLDKYNLYVQPLNKLARGGSRFIFSSQTLSKNLTDCLQKYLDKTKIINNKFRFVNWVFRYNKFRSGDKKFSCHYDSPYHDPSQRHHSRYTLLLYLTSGSADPVLSFGDGAVRIDSINTYGHIKGIIFDQKYKHEGNSFIDGDKIFLRSELVYEYEPEEYQFDDQVAKIFNQACYMTKQSLFNSEVEEFVDTAFNQAAETRVSHRKDFKAQGMLIYKNYEQTRFITNGFDYWFRPDTTLEDATVVALCDFFNCRLESGKFFNKVTSQKKITLSDMNHVDEIFKYLNSKGTKQDESEGEDEDVDVDVDKPQHKKEEKKDREDDEIPQAQVEEGKNGDEDEDREWEDIGYDADDVNAEYPELDMHKPGTTKNCCPNGENINFNHKTNKTVLDCLEILQKDEKETLDKIKEDNVIYILDKKINIKRNNIIVNDKNIVFNHHIPEFNFAAKRTCWECGRGVGSGAVKCTKCEDKIRKDYCWFKSDPKNYLKTEEKEVTRLESLPPIPYMTSKQGHHLKLDIFQSSLVRATKETICQSELV